MKHCNRDCKLCRLHLHCQGCSICEMPLCKQDCEHCFALCPNKGASFAYLRAIGGGQVELAGNEKKNLPVQIPVLPDRLTERMHVRDVIGVHGGNMLSQNGEKISKSYMDRGIQGALNLQKKTRNVLQFYTKDRTLEGFWDNRKALYAQLSQLEWEVIIAPNYSVYEDAPRMDHLYNIKRSSIVYNELLDAGLPAVPDISWYNRIDLDQWIREINQNNVKCIAFSFQTVSTGSKASNTYLHYMMGFKYLTDRISEDVEIIIAGLVSPDRVRLLQTDCQQRLSILNQTAFIQSRRGILSDGYIAAPSGLSKNAIFLRNLDFYDREYGKAGKRNAEAEKQ